MQQIKFITNIEYCKQVQTTEGRFCKIELDLLKLSGELAVIGWYSFGSHTHISGWLQQSGGELSVQVTTHNK